jgi:eukaryotic-like serine/threonine-protein kinase
MPESTTIVLGGRYRLDRRLASGGMGTVWAARDETLNRPVAVKVLNEGLADDERFTERFRREAKAAAGLVHPNVAGVFDYGEDGGRPYIVMEMIEGSTLAQRMAEQSRFPPDEVARIGGDVAATLALAHDHGIVHRDVKPANVMLTGRGEVKVMDFGIAAELLAGVTGLTGTGNVLGTARYISPEQARGERATPASDLYSLGAVMYEMAAGRPPFERPTPMATALAHVNDPLPPLSEARPDVPAHLAGTIERCLAKDPGHRPPSAAVLAAELRGEGPAEPEADTAVLPAADSTDVLEETGAGALAGAASAEPDTDGAITAPLRPIPTRRPGGPRLWRTAKPDVRRAVLILASVVILAVILALVFSSGGAKAVETPRFVGQSRTEAARMAHRLGLDLQFLQGSSERPRGIVFRQFPPPGTAVQVGDTVILRVSSGPATGTGSSPPPPEPGDHGEGKGHGKGKAKGHGKGHGEGD